MSKPWKNVDGKMINTDNPDINYILKMIDNRIKMAQKTQKKAIDAKCWATVTHLEGVIMGLKLAFKMVCEDFAQ